MRSTLDQLTLYGEVRVELERGVIKAVFLAYPFQDGVPAVLIQRDDNADLALMNLWNQLVDALPIGYPHHNKEVSR